MRREEAVEIIERKKRQLSCDLADGLIDDLVPYWDRVEEAMSDALSDAGCSAALAAIRDDEEACDALSSESPFLAALIGRARRG